jgi:hypothetical protein
LRWADSDPGRRERRHRALRSCLASKMRGCRNCSPPSPACLPVVWCVFCTFLLVARRGSPSLCRVLVAKGRAAWRGGRRLRRTIAHCAGGDGRAAGGLGGDFPSLPLESPLRPTPTDFSWTPAPSADPPARLWSPGSLPSSAAAASLPSLPEVPKVRPSPFYPIAPPSILALSPVPLLPSSVTEPAPAPTTIRRRHFAFSCKLCFLSLRARDLSHKPSAQLRTPQSVAPVGLPHFSPSPSDRALRLHSSIPSSLATTSFHHRHRRRCPRRCDRPPSAQAARACAAARARPSASTRTAGLRARTAPRAFTNVTCLPSR